jgi:hypothetical protein
MSLIFASQLSAVATTVLAVLAVVTAWYARRAFIKQSREVAAIEQQVKDGRDLTRQQAELLKLQYEQLDLQRLQFAQAQDDRRRVQASRVFIWTERGADPRFTQAQRAAAPGEYETVTAHVANTSEQPVYDLTIAWRRGTASWGDENTHAVLMPGETISITRNLPPNLPEMTDRRLFSAVARLRDASEVRWLLRPDGQLMEITDDQTGLQP